jgi:hypothetical protein
VLPPPRLEREEIEEDAAAARDEKNAPIGCSRGHGG